MAKKLAIHYKKKEAKIVRHVVHPSWKHVSCLLQLSCLQLYSMPCKCNIISISRELSEILRALFDHLLKSDTVGYCKKWQHVFSQHQ